MDSGHIVTHASPSDAGMAVDGHEVTNGNDDLLYLLREFAGGSKNKSLAGFDVGVQFLEHRDGESCCLACARLCLGNDIRAFQNC